MIKFSKPNFSLPFLLATIILAAVPDTAHATANWGRMVCDFAEQNRSAPAMLNWISRIIGVYFVARTLLLANQHIQDPQRNPFHRIVLHALVASCFLLLPGFVRMLIVSLYTGAAATGGGGGACTPGVVTAIPIAGTSTLGLDVLAQNFVGNTRNPVFWFGQMLAYIVGLFYIVRGLVKLSKYNTDPRAYSPPIIITSFLIGVVLIALGRSKDILMSSVFGAGNTDLVRAATGTGLINWAALGITGNTAGFDNAYIAAITFFQMVGFIAFIRGWMLIKATVEGQGNHTYGQAFTHIIGGVLCMNIILFLRAAEVTFGIDFLT
jgi:hypothetical protein